MSSKVRSLAKARARQQQRDGQITVSLHGLINSNASLGVLIGREMPIRQSFLLGKLVRIVSGEIEQYEASRKALCERYANKTDDDKPRMVDSEGKEVAEGQPGSYDIPKEKMADFDKEHQELLTTEVTLSGAKLKVSDLAGVKIAPAHTMSLDWLICDE